MKAFLLRHLAITSWFTLWFFVASFGSLVHETYHAGVPQQEPIVCSKQNAGCVTVPGPTTTFTKTTTATPTTTAPNSTPTRSGTRGPPASPSSSALPSASPSGLPTVLPTLPTPTLSTPTLPTPTLTLPTPTLPTPTLPPPTLVPHNKAKGLKNACLVQKKKWLLRVPCATGHRGRR